MKSSRLPLVLIAISRLALTPIAFATAYLVRYLLAAMACPIRLRT